MSKDLTKYKFNGQEYGKGRLVLAVMHNFLSQSVNIAIFLLQSDLKFTILTCEF